MGNKLYYEPKIKTSRKPFIQPETGAKMGEEIRTTYKICTNDCISKQRIISFLEDKIRELNYNIYKFDTWHELGEDKEFMKLQVSIYQEVLDFVRGGKE